MLTNHSGVRPLKLQMMIELISLALFHSWHDMRDSICGGDPGSTVNSDRTGKFHHGGLRELTLSSRLLRLDDVRSRIE